VAMPHGFFIETERVQTFFEKYVKNEVNK